MDFFSRNWPSRIWDKRPNIVDFCHPKWLETQSFSGFISDFFLSRSNYTQLSRENKSLESKALKLYESTTKYNFILKFWLGLIFLKMTQCSGLFHRKSTSKIVHYIGFWLYIENLFFFNKILLTGSENVPKEFSVPFHDSKYSNRQSEPNITEYFNAHYEHINVPTISLFSIKKCVRHSCSLSSWREINSWLKLAR